MINIPIITTPIMHIYVIVLKKNNNNAYKRLKNIITIQYSQFTSSCNFIDAYCALIVVLIKEIYRKYI